jgi:hypothetical protein
MDRYDEVTQRIEKSMRRDRFYVPAAVLALVVGMLGLVGTWTSLGSAVKSSRIVCLFNPHTVACRKS